VKALERELRYVPAADEPSARQKHVTVLLDTVVGVGLAYRVAVDLDIAPGSLDVESAVEGKLFVDHPMTVVCPHVVPTVGG
jgi:hypothetical protein